jgi:hypothetical protein
MISGQARARLVEAGAVLAAVALIAGCGSVYRPVVTPINPSGPPAQPASYAVVISDPSPSAPGVATIIDYSGDDIMAQQPIGIGPIAFSVDHLGSTGYTLNSDGTLTSFPVSTSFQELNVQDITLFSTTRLTGLYAPSSGLWASDLDGNVADVLNGSPETFSLSIPIAPTPIAIIGPGTTSQTNFSISQNTSKTPLSGTLLYGVACNISPRTVTQTGEADAIDATTNTVVARIPLGHCPDYAVENSDGNRLFVLNRGDDTITVINSQKQALDQCTCPPTGCLNENNQAYFCHPSLPLSTSAGLTGSNAPTIAGPVYAEFNQATSQLVVADYDGGTITVIDVSLDQYLNDSPTFGTTFTIPVGKNPASVTALPDFSRAYTANQTDGTVSVVNLSSHTLEKTLPVNGHPRTVVSTANSLYGKVYAASPDSPLLSIIRTDQDIPDTTVLVPGNILDVRVSTQNASSGNANAISRMPGAGQPCYLPPAMMTSTYGANYTLKNCQTLP